MNKKATDQTIYNCHIHLFTFDNVPRNFPVPGIGFIRSRPKLIRFIRRVVKFFGGHETADQIERLARMAAEGRSATPERIFNNVAKQYPKGTKFVVLPMDIHSGGYGAPKQDLEGQHDALWQLTQDGAYKDLLIPFAKVPPNNPTALTELRRCVEDKGFKGVKLYPRLGYAPTDDLLRNEVYPYCIKHNLPVLSHCSRGGVFGRYHRGEVGQMLGSPQAFFPVAKEFPELRICLAHFGGSQEWDDYVRGINPFDADARKNNWVTAIYDALKSGDYPNLYTDISYTVFDFEENMPFLSVFLENEAVCKKVLFGSDYYMTKQEDLSERAVSMRLRNALGREKFWQIANANPKAWLEGPSKPKT